MWFSKVYIISIIYGAHWKSHECLTRDLSIPGDVITIDELETKYQIKAHQASLNGSGMSVVWAQPSALPQGQEPGYNPVGHLSRNQKGQAKKDQAAKKLKKKRD